MTDEQIKHMVDRFLGWKLPESFNPDGGITFERFDERFSSHRPRNEPSGTNLFDATQADVMVRYMVEGMPAARAQKIETAALALSTAMVESEADGADYEKVDEQWMRLTEALETR